MIDKICQLLWAWFSLPINQAAKIVKPTHTWPVLSFATLYDIS